jgi:hypothetical protein
LVHHCHCHFFVCIFSPAEVLLKVLKASDCLDPSSWIFHTLRHCLACSSVCGICYMIA